MPANKLALLRYRIIDECLQNRHRKWTLENLIDKVSDALYEYEGIQSGISKRTIQLDIQTMRSDKLGYNAPIIVTERKYYSYADHNYSMTNAKVSPQDMEKLQEVMSLLNQFKGFTYFEDLSAMLGKLEDKILRQQQSEKVYIDFEKNELLKGLKWIDPLLEAVKKEQVLEISYQSFRARTPKPYLIHPYLLKEYRNRWFILCYNEAAKRINLLALDRIEDIETQREHSFRAAVGIDLAHYFDNVIGVTKTENQAETHVILSFNKNMAPYILTKPLHRSQNVRRQDEKGIIIEIFVVWNLELERELLSYAESVEVLAPIALKKRIANRLERAWQIYQK